MPTWPATLPQVLLVDGYAESPPNTMLRTEMDAGPAKMRQRYTAAPRPISGAVILDSKAQLNTFAAFFVTDPKGGTLTFTWEDRDAVTRTYAFTATPAYEFLEPDMIRVVMTLEIRP